MNCQKCGQETILPFQCPYCRGQFCSEHRLPENHACSKINLARSKQQENVLAPNNSFQYSYSYGPSIKNKGRIYFSPKELKHITVATLLVIGIGFSIGLYGNFFYGVFSWNWDWSMMTVFAFLITLSFLTHEIAHKIVAQKRGLWAEFRLTTWGALLTLASVFLPFKMISPGAMMIAGSPNGDAIVKISLAGPVTNMILSAGLLGVASFIFPSAYSLPLFFAAYVNGFIALFNLIPFGVLDGLKIYNWNKKIWACAFAISVALTIFTFLLT